MHNLHALRSLTDRAAAAATHVGNKLINFSPKQILGVYCTQDQDMSRIISPKHVAAFEDTVKTLK